MAFFGLNLDSFLEILELAFFAIATDFRIRGDFIWIAESEHIDLIVMGTHGSRGLSRLLLGSVAESVVREALCPARTVKQPAVVAIRV